VPVSLAQTSAFEGKKKKKGSSLLLKGKKKKKGSALPVKDGKRKKKKKGATRTSLWKKGGALHRSGERGEEKINNSSHYVFGKKKKRKSSILEL